ncbi:MAG: alpha/beta hydrolase [Nitrososphaera sp.]
MRSNVSFKSNNLKLAGHLYVPDDYKKGEKRPAIVVSHPFGGVKEQTAGLYAKKLSEKGFITLAFDASYQGESEGEPQFLEDPFARVEDIKSAVSFLESRDEVDHEDIGALGICASGGYVPFAAQTDLRIKAVATVSGADMGDLFRKGLNTSIAPNLDHLLEESNKARTEEAQGKPPRLEHIVPNTPEEIPKDTPPGGLYREGTDYYRTPRDQHPNSKNWFLLKSVDQIVEYSSYDHVDMISPCPLLMIAGTKADTRFYSEMAIDKAKEPRELFLIDGATHIALYDKPEYVNPAVEKMNSFFEHYLQSANKLPNAENKGYNDNKKAKNAKA